MNLVIANRQRAKKINTRLLRQITGGLFAELKIAEAELGVNLVATSEMTLINETFLQHEGPTDVITFDHRDAEQASRLPADGASSGKRPLKQKRGRRDACPTLHGELFICVDVALAQAKEFGTSWQAEVVRYLVHGVLHLLGHDDRRASARNTMKREENRLLRALAKRFSLAQLSSAVKLRA